MCNSLLINDVVIDWEKIDQGSYLRDIIAFSGVVQISFDHAVTFLAGENGSGKSTLLEAIAIVYGFNPKGGMRYYKFSTYVPISNCAVRFASPEMFGGLDMAIFCRQKEFITLPRRKENTAEDWAAGRSISKRNRIWKHTDESVRVVEEAIIEQQI